MVMGYGEYLRLIDAARIITSDQRKSDAQLQRELKQKEIVRTQLFI